MLRQAEIWSIMRDRLPRGKWISLREIYDLVERHANFDDEDFMPQPNSTTPKWKRNVRNVLQGRKNKGEIRWNHDAGYFLP